MKLVRDPDPAVVQTVRALQASFCRLGSEELAGRDPAWVAHILELARSGLAKRHQEALAQLDPAEAARLQRNVDASLVMDGYALARRQASGLDSPLDLAELFDLWDETQAGLTRWGDDFDHADLEVVMATALHRSHNARTFCVDRRGPHIVLFQDRLLQLLNELAAVAVSTLPPDETCSRLVHGRRQVPDPLPRVGRGGARALQEALERFLSRHAHQRWQEPARTLTRIADPRGDLAFDLYQGMKFFVMGHEMAHIELKHETSSGAALVLGEGEETAAGPVHELVRAHREELEADVVGLHIGMCTAGANGVALHTYFIAALLFFYGVEWIGKAKTRGAPSGRGDEPPEPTALPLHDSHPPLASRRRALAKAILSLRSGSQTAPYDLSFVLGLDRGVRRALARRSTWQTT